MSSLRNHLDLGVLALKDGPHSQSARRDAELLLTHTLKKSRAWLLAHGDEFLSDEFQPGYRELLERRRRGEPIQYITGEAEFYGLPFRVTPDVLIPRPETEHVVEKVIELATRFRQPRIVDVGTGSGAIAVALAHKLPHAQITAIDISPRALAIARENAKRNGVVLHFLLGDLLAPVAGEMFEIVVSNPPYVSAADRVTLSVEVRDYEPAQALFAGDDGLDVYRRLIPAAFEVLISGGYLALEIGSGQSMAIAKLLARAGFERTEFVPDLQKIPRVACARRP
ncbi:MAG: peptide chain release factor N(5)-glutamine methyltransferase [Terracidiphilus sp.]|jgi:release factor glutamine methyltransferase